MADVLVVDDDPNMRSAIRRTLVARGHRVTLAEQGSAALEAIAASVPDLIITDLSMPVMDGWELLASIRGDTCLSAIPVIVVSDSLDARATALANAVLPKPFDVDQLMRVMSALIEAASGDTRSSRLSAAA